MLRLGCLKQISNGGKAKSSNSLDRFARAARRTREFGDHNRSEQKAVDYAFESLRHVAQPGYTQWSIVYDQKRGKIHFRTMQNPQIRTIDAKAFDYACGTTVKMFDMNSTGGGDVTSRFNAYTRQANRDLIERSFGGTDFLQNIPAPLKNLLALYPEGFGCSNQKAS